MIFYNYLFPNRALIPAQQMALLGFMTTTLYRTMIWTHVSRAAPDWDLWRTLFQLSYTAAAQNEKRWHQTKFPYRNKNNTGKLFSILRLWAYCASPADGVARNSFFTTRSRKHKLSCLVPSNHLMPKKNKTFVMIWDRSRIHMSPLYSFSPENEALRAYRYMGNPIYL